MPLHHVSAALPIRLTACRGFEAHAWSNCYTRSMESGIKEKITLYNHEITNF
jgi:hypothetical protein